MDPLRAMRKYQARFDLDGDGEIAFSDFLVFVDSFGDTVPSLVSVCDRTPAVRDSIMALVGCKHMRRSDNGAFDRNRFSQPERRGPYGD